MAEVEERLVYLEGRAEEYSHMLDGIRDAIVHLEQRIDARFEAVDHRFASIDQRFDTIDRRFEAIERRFEIADQKVDRGFAALDAKMFRQFLWIIGVQVTTFTAIVIALAGR